MIFRLQIWPQGPGSPTDDSRRSRACNGGASHTSRVVNMAPRKLDAKEQEYLKLSNVVQDLQRKLEIEVCQIVDFVYLS